MVATVIFNPYAGRWKGQRLRQEAEAALRNAGIVFKIIYTEYKGHAVAIAKKSVLDSSSLLIAAGGDGTISEVVNGMMQAVDEGAKLPPLGIIPLGTANDFVANVGLPQDFNAATHVIASGVPKSVDLGLLKYTIQGVNGPEVHQCYFDNNSAIGLEPCVTLIQQKIGWLKGTLRYLVSAVLGVLQKRSWQSNIEWEHGTYAGKISLVTVGNGRITGGFYMTPHANPFDGKLTFVYGFVPSRREMFGLLPRALKPGPGSYVEAEKIHEFDSSWIRVRTLVPTPVHADGEIQSEATNYIEWSILPQALKVILPK